MDQDKKKKKTGEDPGDERVEFDFGCGKLSFGGILNGLSNLIELANDLAEEGGEIKKEKSFTAKGPAGKDLKGIFGVSIRTLDMGKSVLETFGNIKETPHGPIVEEVREPIVDLFDEDGYIRLIAELPGVSEEEVQLDLEGDILSLKAKGRERKYAKEVLFPCSVKKESLAKNFRNGILELTLQKA